MLWNKSVQGAEATVQKHNRTLNHSYCSENDCIRDAQLLPGFFTVCVCKCWSPTIQFVVDGRASAPWYEWNSFDTLETTALITHSLMCFSYWWIRCFYFQVFFLPPNGYDTSPLKNLLPHVLVQTLTLSLCCCASCPSLLFTLWVRTAFSGCLHGYNPRTPVFRLCFVFTARKSLISESQEKLNTLVI